jgi:DNA polymerase
VVLEELGLAPVWRLRDRAVEGDAGATATGSPEAPIVSAAAKSAPASASQDRIVRIAQMDWPDLRACVAGCEACDLHKSRNNTVFGVGDEDADWMLIGEAPGAEEDARGEPFVGQAGQLLDNMIGAIGLARGKKVYISNVLKCRPPGNRNPDAAEVAQCKPHLLRQVSLVRPKLILAMGRFAVQALLGTDATIASLRGRLHEYQGVPMIVTYHPAYLLRTLADKSKAWEDLCLARDTMQGLLSAGQPQS